MISLIYILCALTSGLCSFLLLRSYARNGVRLIWYIGICFLFLTLNNFLLVAEHYTIVPEITVLRIGCALAGLAVFITGGIREMSRS